MTQTHKDVYVPNGITFGRKVAVIPPVLDSFSHGGDMENGGKLNESYSWIDRGEDLGRYVIHVDKVEIPIIKHFVGTEPRKASIPSPVSGLLVHSSYSLGLENTAILLPDDEPEAIDCKQMFRSLIHLLRDEKRYFLKPSRYWTQDGWSEERFEKQLHEQTSQKIEYVDALPRFKDYFDEARARHPSIRPHLKHIV